MGRTVSRRISGEGWLNVSISNMIERLGNNKNDKKMGGSRKATRKSGEKLKAVQESHG